MTINDKLDMLKVLLGEEADNHTEDELSTFLAIARQEILQWKYSLVGGVPEDVEDVAEKDEMVQIQAVIIGINIQGAEGQSISIENGIHRNFDYSSMVSYIRANVLALVRLG